MPAEISPVKAPLSWAETSWAPYLIGSLSVRRAASFWTRTTASWWLRFIFQLPAMIGRRLWRGMSGLQYVDAGELLALEVLQAGAAAGGDVSEGRLVEA